VAQPPLDKFRDRRAVEGVMQQFAAGLQGRDDPDTPLAKGRAILSDSIPRLIGCSHTR
jgi:hypothetical protein